MDNEEKFMYNHLKFNTPNINVNTPPSLITMSHPYTLDEWSFHHPLLP
jgi:hypothetical protein